MLNHFCRGWRWLHLVAPLPLFLTLAGGMVAAAEKNPLVVAGQARFTIVTSSCVRMEYSPSGQFVDEPSLFAAERNVRHEFTHRLDGDVTVIATRHFELRYKPDGKPFNADNLEIFIGHGEQRVRWVPGMVNRHNLGGTLRTLDQIRGKVPLGDGVLARDGWYLLDDSRRPLFKDGWVASRAKDSGSDWYLFAYGNDFKEALRSLTAIGGKVPLPRKYTLGSWYSRYWPYTSKEFREIVDEYRQHDFPLDVMVLDMDWHKDGWTGWSWNRELLPDAEELLAWLHSQGLYVTLNVHPADGIGPHEDMYAAFMRDMGADISADATGKKPWLKFDAADKKYLDTLFQHTHLPLEKSGVDFWWLDWQQYEFTRGNPELRNLEWLNHYYFQHTARDDKRGVSFSRWGGWGDHRYPIHFSGDAVSIWPMLEFEVPFTTLAGNVGCFFWSHDIGGHFGGLTPETNARWVQFGAFTAALRLHSTRDKNMDKRPWLSEKRYAECMRIVFHLRAQMFPYIYTSAAQSCRESLPLTRAMYMDYPDQEIAYQCPQQYLFGDLLLVAPIVTPGTGEGLVSCQRVWFPAGVWYNWFTGERYVGGDSMHNVWADIYELPLYARGGMPMPLQPYTRRMASEPLRHLVVRTYPGMDGGEGSFTLYEDDGVSQDYLRGQSATTAMHYRRTGNRHEVRIDGSRGGFRGQPQQRAYTFEFPCTQPAGEVSVNGKAAACDYDAARATNVVRVAELPITDSVTVAITAAEVDFASLHHAARGRRIEGMLGKQSNAGVAADIAARQRDAKTALDAYHATSLLSGISVYAPDNRTIHVLKEKGSPVTEPCLITVTDVLGDEQRAVCQQTVALEAGSSHRLEIAQQLSPCFGVRNVREAAVQFTIDGKEFVLRQVVAERDSGISRWHMVGPFSFDIKRPIGEQPHAPELAKEISLDDAYQGSEGAPVKWQLVDADSDDIVDIRARYDYDFRIAYAVAYLKSEQDQHVEFLVNSDDGVEVWLNHKKIHSHHVFRAISHEPDRAHSRLHKGINTLLVKISQGEGGWCFKVRVKSQFPLMTAASRDELK